jgi:hypothetical protein
MRPQGLCQWKIAMTPSEIEPATFRFPAQCLKQLRYRDLWTVVNGFEHSLCDFGPVFELCESTRYCYAMPCKITVAVYLLITFGTICSRRRLKLKADTAEFQWPISKQIHYFTLDVAAYTHSPTRALFGLWLAVDRIHKGTIHYLLRSDVSLISWDVPTQCCYHTTCLVTHCLLDCRVRCSFVIRRNLFSSEHICRELV